MIPIAIAFSSLCRWRADIVGQAHRCRRIVWGLLAFVRVREQHRERLPVGGLIGSAVRAQPAPVDPAPADLAPVNLAPTALAAAEPVAPTTSLACVQQRVLLIDDEPVLRVALRRYFQRRQWEVEEADDGAAALRMLEGSPPGHYGAVLTDLKMPRVSGVEVHDFLAQRRPDLQARLIVMTGDAASPVATEFISRASCPVLQKPFELAMLARTIEGLQHQAGAVASG